MTWTSQRLWYEFSNYLGNVSMVFDTLRRLSTWNVAHREESKKQSAKDVHRFIFQRVYLTDFSKGYEVV